MKTTAAPVRSTLCSFLLVLQTTAFSAAEARQQQPTTNSTSPFVLQDGTPVKLRLSQTVSSADAHVNDRVEFDVLEDVLVSNTVVVPKGSAALGTVTEAVPKKRMARGGKLEIVMDSVRLVDGEKVALRAVKEGKGGGHTGGMTVGIVAAAVVFWPAAPLFLLMHGKDITFPKGTDVPTFVNGDMKLDPARFQIAGSGAPSVETASTSLAISSTPVGADIYLDQKFVGNTPSTLKVPAGNHTVSIRKTGFQDWVRELNVSAGAITLSAELAAGSNSPSHTSSAAASQTGDLTPPEIGVAEAARLNKAARAKEQQPQH